ncbi:ABC transporter substrate-binding protein [Alicyclobacillus sp.]|uniref:ABC transporter substrate-binding protein n=1 Tax=Alicyclobacillus sp. TaxID=61169 RepID=UPI0025BC6368|nr:ABC transporter substrate-binding protein [Alicyclobacillus sp.]MCL6517469.1 ABC transporter substrate-binding protein [Alicyclobacillus sp.]
MKYGLRNSKHRVKIFTGILCLLTVACGGPVGTNTSGSQMQTAPSTGTNEIRLGLMTDLTGPSALSGHHDLNGAQLAVDQINASGGIQGKTLKLIAEDDQGQNQAGVSAFQKLSSNQDIVAIIGENRSTIVQATLPYVQQAKIPVMIGGTNVGLTHTGNRWVFRCRPNDQYAAQVMARYASEDLHAKTAAILHDTDAFGSGGDTLLKTYLPQNGVQIVSDQGYTTATKDFTPYLENVKSSHADVLLTYMTNSEDAAQMLRQFRQLGLSTKILGSPSIATSVTIKLAGDAVNGVYGVSDFVQDANNAAKKFTEDYVSKYNEQPDLFASWAYDAVMILKEVMTKYGTDPDQIRTGILSMKGYQGVEGLYNFDQNGDGLHGYTVVQVENRHVKSLKFVDMGQ